jgi:hypothetical protein
MNLVGDRAAPLPAHVQVRGRAVPVWPDGQGWSIVCEASMAITRFADHATYGDDLAGDALTAESDARFGGATGPGKRAACGHKVYDLPRWRTPAADLVHARALAFAQRCLSCVEVIADDTWCSIYRDGDYCLPHSHLRSEVSLIYMLDPGETVADDSHSGLLCFNDARIAWCCPEEHGRATRVLVPEMSAGTLLLFDSAYLHSVTPYRGRRPRITLSWNVGRRRLPGTPRPGM